MISFVPCSKYLLIFYLLLKRKIDRLVAAVVFVVSHTSNCLRYSIFAVVNVAVMTGRFSSVFYVYWFVFVFIFLSPLLLHLFLLLFIIFAVLW